MNTDKMWRVLITHWESEMFTECWTKTAQEAERIASALRQQARLGNDDITCQIDAPKEK